MLAQKDTIALWHYKILAAPGVVSRTTPPGSVSCATMGRATLV